MKVLTRSEILAQVALPSEVVEVPEWGGSVCVRGMTGTQRDGFEASVVSMKGKDTSVNLVNIRAKLCAQCVVGEDGKRLFEDGDVMALGELSAAALDRVFEVAQRLSGLSKTDVDTLVKN